MLLKDIFRYLVEKVIYGVPRFILKIFKRGNAPLKLLFFLQLKQLEGVNSVVDICKLTYVHNCVREDRYLVSQFPTGDDLK